MQIRTTTEISKLVETVELVEELEWLRRKDEHPLWWMNSKEQFNYRLEQKRLINKVVGMVDSENFK